ncbi:DUF4359 domain-containing protein [Phormidesmis priestleyi]
MAHIPMPQFNTVPPKRPWGMLFVAGLGLTLLGVTNPSQANYSSYAAWSLKENTCEQKPLSPIVQAICPVIASLPNGLTAQFISQYTRRDNYLFFSIYHTKFLDAEVQKVGIAGHFF